jgi:hypothetical protein
MVSPISSGLVLIILRNSLFEEGSQTEPWFSNLFAVESILRNSLFEEGSQTEPWFSNLFAVESPQIQFETIMLQ